MSKAEEQPSKGTFDPKPLDGVIVNAVENFLNPKPSQITLGVGIYPLDPYTTGMSVNASYTYRFSQNFAWEVVNGSYVYSFDKGLTAQLADRYGVNPTTINRLNYQVSSNLVFVHTHGKLVFLKRYIRSFESSLILGAGLLSTSQGSSTAGNFGVNVEIFLSNTFSLKVDIRDSLTTDTLTNYLVFTLGTGISF